MIEETTEFHTKVPDHVLDCMRVLSNSGREAWLVGGSVRDFCMGREPLDYDLTTDATPDETMRLFSGRKILTSGLRHGTVTVLIEGRPVEITTYRTEGAYTDGRRPDYVRFTPSLEEDLKRRDFTVNTLVLNEQGVLRDYTGGLADLHAGLIRCVGDPRERFREDALRILRALRFASVLGFILEPETAEAAVEESHLLGQIAAERVWTEFSGLLTGTNVRRVLEDYREVIAAVIPETKPMMGLNQRNPYHCHDVWSHTAHVVEAVPPNKTLRLAAFFHDIGKPATFTVDEKGVGHFYGHDAVGAEMTAQILSRMKSDSQTLFLVEKLVAIHCIPLSADNKIIRRRLRQFGPEILKLLIALKIADAKGQSELSRDRIGHLIETREAIQLCIREKECFSLEHLELNGADLLRLGFGEGPSIGLLLDEILEKVIRGDLVNHHDELIRYASERGDESQKDPVSPAK